MTQGISRRTFLSASAAFAAICAAGLTGCSGSGSSDKPIHIGTMPTEDILPMWVAQSEKMFEAAGVNAQVDSFDSAPNLSAAIVAGEIDLAMTDPMRAAKLFESGTDVVMEWITLGTTPEQGRFGVLASKESGAKKLSDLVGCKLGVGLAANTVPEYVFEMLCEKDGLDLSKIKTSEVPSLPDRYSMVMQGKLDAAALPASMLALGEHAGLTVIADDTKGDNISQSVMVARRAWLEEGGAEKLDALRKAWNDGAAAINADPEKYRDVLVENANLNSDVAATYKVNTYPLATVSADDTTPAFPPAELIDPQLKWMLDRGYLKKSVSYDATSGGFTA